MNANLQKLLIRMSKIAIYAMILCFSLTLALAHESVAQRKYLSEISIDLDYSGSSLLDLISTVESSTDFHFAYSKKVLKDKSVDISPGEWNMSDLLKEISIQGEVSLRRINETITIKQVDRVSSLPNVQEEIMVQQGISGTVTDENGEPLPGATIVEKGTTNGTITDIEGKFSLNVSDDAVLLVSFVGYQPQEIVINDQSSIDVTMQPDYESLEEVVVVGYGTNSKQAVTGAVATADLQTYNQVPVNNVLETVKGTLPGLNVSGINSAGQVADITIRGQNSIGASNSPLIVIDGIIYNGSLGDIRSGDIESLTVLKDASAAAVYGARSANGVILIETKKGGGLDGKPQFNL
ncbi:MAG: carboxypeptidase-like regulatory domain-containing protein, partial [Cyclobacteriaceae bacterium]